MSNQGRDAFDELIEKLDAAEARIAELEAWQSEDVSWNALVQMQARADAAEAEVVRLTEERDLTQRSHHSEEVKNFHLRAEIAALREAALDYKLHSTPVLGGEGASSRLARLLAVSQEQACTCKTESTAPGMPHADYCALMQEEK